MDSTEDRRADIMSGALDHNLSTDNYIGIFLVKGNSMDQCCSFLMAYDGFKVFFEGGVSIHKRLSVVASCFIFLFRAQPFEFTKMYTYVL